MEQLEAWNRSLFLAINGKEDAARWLVDLAVFIGEFMIYLIPLLLLWMWLWGERPRRELALKAFLVSMVAVGINQIIPLFYQHPRPFELGMGHAWIAHVADSSFPSDHATVFSALGISLLFGGEVGLGVLTIFVGALVAWARIFLGVHFPLDMMGAMVVALVAYAVAAPLWKLAGPNLLDAMLKTYRVALSRPIASGWIKG